MSVEDWKKRLGETRRLVCSSGAFSDDDKRSNDNRSLLTALKEVMLTGEIGRGSFSSHCADNHPSLGGSNRSACRTQN
jgi:hypothetical protein